MKHLAPLLCAWLLCANARAAEPGAATAEQHKHEVEIRAAGLVVHEWGVATYVQGREGGRLDQPAADASDLPAFVESRKKLAESAPQIQIEIDKPIVYFYTPGPETITFTVACPKGLLTDWYPKAFKVLPDPGAQAASGGLLQWRNFDLTPAAPGPLPPTGDNAWWWPICRETDAATLSAEGQLEKFIFYHGTLGDAPPLLNVEGGGEQKFTLTNTSKKETVTRIAILHISQGKATARYLAKLAPGESQKVEIAMPGDASPTAKVADMLSEKATHMLIEEGLFTKEAAGMIKIWRKTWFEKEGIRILYLNPPGETAALLPLSIDPKPVSLVRTLVIGVECMTDSRENIIKTLITQLGDGNYTQRKNAQDKLIELGRQVEAPLKEALKKSDDEEVRAAIELILHKLDPRSNIPVEPKPNEPIPEN